MGFLGRCNKEPQTWWLKTTDVCSLKAPEARVCNQGVGRTMLPLMALEAPSCLFQLLVAPGTP